MEQKNNIEILEMGEFEILHIFGTPQRIESKIIFDRENISQKLIFTLMEISHNHGFGCSPPYFRDSDMVFLVGTILPTKKSVNKYSKKLYNCLLEIVEFSNKFIKQLDFSQLDLSMFVNMDVEEFSPEQIAAVRDQHYDGSWEDFYEDLLGKDKELEADIVRRCVKFEKINQKDIGLVGHKLSYIVQILDETDDIEKEIN
jgi:hypothetical protein